jgi:VWFA-related protein
MQRRRLAFRAAVILVALAGGLGASRQTAPQAAQAPPPKPLDLVPVSVHVLDKTGKPITDLTQSDFTISENGSAQQTRYFATQNLTAETPAADARLALRTRMTLAPQNYRIFVIMLGRGRLEDTSKALTGLAAFVRKLLPQDLVAVFAQNRALAFTNDHEKVVQALDRCRKAHLDVDLDVDSQLGPTGMASLYGTKAISRKTQTKIDDMVLGPGAKPPAVTPGDAIEMDAFRNLSLDDFMFTSAQTLTDQGNVRSLIEYLRRYDGEKHLLFVTEKGVDKAAAVPSEELDRDIAQAASDGWVAIDTLPSGGIADAPSGADTLGATQAQALALKSLRNISDMSGGMSAVMDRNGAALDRLNDVTKNGYLLGYQSTHDAWDGSYRNIVVKVNRPDATVFYRHGYYREANAGGVDRRGDITTDRLMAAGNFRREVSDIKIKAKASQGQGGSDLTVEGKVDLAKVTLATLDGKHVGKLDVAVFCIDSSGWSVGTHTSTMSISLSEEDFARYQKDGMPYSVHVPLSRGTSAIRFVVYDYRADLIGRADTKVF